LPSESKKGKMEVPAQPDEQTLYQHNSYDPEEAAFDFVDDYQPEPSTNTLEPKPAVYADESYAQDDLNAVQYATTSEIMDGYHDGAEFNPRQRLPSLSAELKVIRRESLNEITSVVNTTSNPYVQNEFGNLEDDGGLFTLIPLETQLQVTYTWNVSRKNLLESEKLVSLPFGPKDWSWQMM
jgi:hypothetical protein